MQPNGLDLMSTLLKLLAEQEGVEITYTLTDGKTCVRKTTGKNTQETWEAAS